MKNIKVSIILIAILFCNTSTQPLEHYQVAGLTAGVGIASTVAASYIHSKHCPETDGTQKTQAKIWVLRAGLGTAVIFSSCAAYALFSELKASGDRKMGEELAVILKKIVEEKGILSVENKKHLEEIQQLKNELCEKNEQFRIFFENKNFQLEEKDSVHAEFKNKVLESELKYSQYVSEIKELAEILRFEQDPEVKAALYGLYQTKIDELAKVLAGDKELSTFWQSVRYVGNTVLNPVIDAAKKIAHGAKEVKAIAMHPKNQELVKQYCENKKEQTVQFAKKTAEEIKKIKDKCWA